MNVNVDQNFSPQLMQLVCIKQKRQEACGHMVMPDGTIAARLQELWVRQRRTLNALKYVVGIEKAFIVSDEV